MKSRLILALSLCFLFFWYQSVIFVLSLMFFTFLFYFLCRRLIKKNKSGWVDFAVIAYAVSPMFYGKIVGSSSWEQAAGLSILSFNLISFYLDSKIRHPLGSFGSASDFLIYIFYFPKFLAGPIERFNSFSLELKKPFIQSREILIEGSFLIYSGLFKKIFLAPLLSPQTNGFFTGDANGIIFHMTTFTVQLYCDFSAYSDIASGISKFLGIELSKNFNLPLYSRGPQEFFRRWNISLSAWIRDYVSMPLLRKSGNVYLSVLLGFMVMGFWHGLSFKYLLLGLLPGAWVLAHSISSPALMLKPYFDLSVLKFIFNLGSWLITFSFISVAFFLIPSPSIGWYAEQSLTKFLDHSTCNWTTLIYAFLGLLSCEFIFIKIEFWDRIKRSTSIGDYKIMSLAMLFFIAIEVIFGQNKGSLNTSFIYFQF